MARRRTRGRYGRRSRGRKRFRRTRYKRRYPRRRKRTKRKAGVVEGVTILGSTRNPLSTGPSPVAVRQTPGGMMMLPNGLRFTTKPPGSRLNRQFNNLGFVLRSLTNAERGLAPGAPIDTTEYYVEVPPQAPQAPQRDMLG